MVLTAVVLSVLWCLTAGVLRVALQRWRTGDSGIRAATGPRFSVDWWARALFVVGTVLVVAGPVLAGVDVIGRTEAPAPVAWSGVVLAASGVALTFAAQMSMGASWRIGVDAGERTALVTGGMFAVVRNPIFTAMLATALGLALMVPTVVGVVGLALSAAAIEVQVRSVEEPYLRSIHGDRYAGYGRVVGRFLPGIGRLA